MTMAPQTTYSCPKCGSLRLFDEGEVDYAFCATCFNTVFIGTVLPEFYKLPHQTGDAAHKPRLKNTPSHYTVRGPKPKYD